MRRQPRLCPQSSPEEEEGVPALPVLVSSLTPSFRRGPRDSQLTSATQCHGLGELTLPTSWLHSAPPYQWVTVTMETS